MLYLSGSAKSLAIVTFAAPRGSTGANSELAAVVLANKGLTHDCEGAMKSPSITVPASIVNGSLWGSTV
jgi:hypothetical protein